MGWHITLHAHPSGRGRGESQAGCPCHQSALKKEPSGFPAKNNRNQITLRAPRECFCRKARVNRNSGVAPLFYTPLWIQQEPGFCLRYSFTPKLPVPVSPCPTQQPRRLGGCAGDSPHGSRTGTATARPQQGRGPAAPAAHAQWHLRHPIPVRSYGCPETHGHGGQSWPVELFAANNAAA